MRKVVVITGATDGIGRALSVLLSKEYDLALCGRSESKMKTLLEALEPCQVYQECFDITKDEERNGFCKHVIEQFGHIDILVNNAGANIKKDKVTDICLDELRYMFELNCVSAVGMIQNIYPVMAKQQRGFIVNILSSCCLYHNQTMGSYTASKDAMEAISKILLKEVKGEHIGVCSVYPGGVDTNFRPQEKPEYLRPETVAKMVKACMENEDGCVHDIVLRPESEDNLA